MSKKPKKKPLTPEQIAMLVFKMADAGKETMKSHLVDVPERIQWLIMSRAVNYLFDDHYSSAMNVVRRQVQKRKAHEKAKQ